MAKKYSKSSYSAIAIIGLSAILISASLYYIFGPTTKSHQIQYDIKSVAVDISDTIPRYWYCNPIDSTKVFATVNYNELYKPKLLKFISREYPFMLEKAVNEWVIEHYQQQIIDYDFFEKNDTYWCAITFISPGYKTGVETVISGNIYSMYSGEKQ